MADLAEPRPGAGASPGCASPAWRRLPGPICTWSMANSPIRSFRSFPATRSSDGSIGSGPGVDALAHRTAGRHPVAGIYLRCLPPIAGAVRKNLCDRPAVHRLHPRWRLCDACPWRMRDSCFRCPRRGDDVANRAIAVRRADRLAFPCASPGDGKKARPVRFFGAAGAHHCAGSRALAGPAGSLRSPGPAMQGPRIFARLARRRMGGSLGPEVPRKALDCAIIFAPVGALVPAALQSGAQGAAVSSVPASTCPTSRALRTAYCGKSGRSFSVANLTRDERAGILRHRRAGQVSSPSRLPIRSRRRTKRSVISGRDVCRGAAVLVP